MLTFRLTVFTLLFCGTCGFTRYWFNLFNNCNPPEKVLGKFCAALLDNDVNDDGRVDGKDMSIDGLFYDYGGDLCKFEPWEFVVRWTCRYGYSEEYAHFMDKLFSGKLEGVELGFDFETVNITNADFLSMQYTRFKNQYCSDPKNRENPVDRVQCAEVDELKPEDVKCT